MAYLRPTLLLRQRLIPLEEQCDSVGVRGEGLALVESINGTVERTVSVRQRVDLRLLGMFDILGS